MSRKRRNSEQRDSKGAVRGAAEGGGAKGAPGCAPQTGDPRPAESAEGGFRSPLVLDVIGRAVPIRGDDIDTDRIIPARFMKTVTFDELGRYAFNDERFGESGDPLDHPMNDPRHEGASIMLVNKNFGCGSSREHAPQALVRRGIRGLIGESFAEIFSSNCTALGIPAVRVDGEDIERLMRLVEQVPETTVRISLEEMRITASVSQPEHGGPVAPASRGSERDPDGEREITVSFRINPAEGEMFRSGTWDTTATLLRDLDGIRRTAARLPYVSGFAADEA